MNESVCPALEMVGEKISSRYDTIWDFFFCSSLLILGDVFSYISAYVYYIHLPDMVKDRIGIYDAGVLMYKE